jgi:hypothetical protein
VRRGRLGLLAVSQADLLSHLPLVSEPTRLFCHVNNVSFTNTRREHQLHLFSDLPNTLSLSELNHNISVASPRLRTMMNTPPTTHTSGRRVMSGSDANVTFRADDNAQLVPPPTSKSDSSRERESKGSGRRTSNFSQQISATRYGTSHLYKRTNRPEDDAVTVDRSRKQDGRFTVVTKLIDEGLPTLEPKVYTPARHVHEITTSRDQEKPATAHDDIALSRAQLKATPPARRRPPPLATQASKSLHPKRSLSNFKLKGEEFTRSVREKFGILSATSPSGDLSAQQVDGNSESAVVASDKALRVLGAKGDATATTRASSESRAGGIASLFRTPNHSASDTSRTSTTSMMNSDDEYQFDGRKYLTYLNNDTPPTPPTQKKSFVPLEDLRLSARFESSASPSKARNPLAKSVAGYREKPDVNVSDVQLMYGAFGTTDEATLTRTSREEDEAIGGLKPILEYTPSTYSSVSVCMLCSSSRPHLTDVVSSCVQAPFTFRNRIRLIHKSSTFPHLLCLGPVLKHHWPKPMATKDTAMLLEAQFPYHCTMTCHPKVHPTLREPRSSATLPRTSMI